MERDRTDWGRLEAARAKALSFKVDVADNEYSALWLAVLAQSIEDALTPPRPLRANPSRCNRRDHGRRVEAYQGAREWFLNPSVAPRTFRWICDTVLNADADEVLAVLKVTYPGLQSLPNGTRGLTEQLASATVAA